MTIDAMLTELWSDVEGGFDGQPEPVKRDARDYLRRILGMVAEGLDETAERCEAQSATRWHSRAEGLRYGAEKLRGEAEEPTP